VTKRRLDTILVERGLVETRSKAQALVMAGQVWSGTRRLDKPGSLLDPGSAIEVRGREHPWVSRGGLKLAHALEHFAIDPTNAVALDIGASTGGFTDVLLHRGALRIYAVDVGHGQLDWKLRGDSRVVLLERVNARNLSSAEVPEPIDLIVCDVSFIGLTIVLPAAMALAAPRARLVALIKPQFEVGKGKVGKGGIVRDPELHREVCERISAWLSAQPGWRVAGITESPILGSEGNREFLIGAGKAEG
jgi:23S rRNA (cytidine1920-2'-O)/16S rRNA (cytidine1409-2'-O)-methyltransferase